MIDRLLPDLACLACLAARGGRWEKHCRQVIVDAIPDVVDNGIKWRALPADFPPWQTVYKCFSARSGPAVAAQPADPAVAPGTAVQSRPRPCRRATSSTSTARSPSSASTCSS
ncbi:hypothetical protein ALI22I_00580 [Saccharothrix sp. ALI-22-I]|uniref:transposase n=1 Tax=Saccharothrix sp. ALI-22-I TaxID=1933778 RepID=UPI00097BBB39|nr:hypothetical protein ALI22I_00580 [Saccharothrix sp. ALI-22-I]